MKKIFLVFAMVLFALTSCSLNDSSSDNPSPTPVLPDPKPEEKKATVILESEYFTEGKKTSDWLFVFYLDGDNSIESNIWTDLNEIEYGLGFVREGDGSTKSDYESARCVVLWDGKNGDLANSHVYEIGADDKIDLKLNGTTMDISGVGFIKDNEVDMSDCSTLEKFLVWVNEHYSAKKTVLQIADHGCGAGGISTHLNDSTRTMLEDSTTSSYSIMTTKEFASGLKNAGYGVSKKFDLMLFDICFGSSIEELYEFRNFSKYYIGSPNATPGPGFSYHNFFKNLKKGIETESFGRKLCDIFESDYYKFQIYWKNISRMCYNTTDPGNEKLAEMNWGTCLSGDYTIPTITMVNLSKVELCADKVDALACAIKDKTKFKKYLYVDTSKFPVASSSNYLYYPTLTPRIDSPWTFDIGYFASKVYGDEESDAEVKNAAKELMDVLQVAICTSWRGSLYSLNGELCPISKLEETETISFYKYLDLNCCGISISGGSRVNSGLNNYYLKTGKICSWYESELLFGARSGGWTDLLKSWFGE